MKKASLFFASVLALSLQCVAATKGTLVLQTGSDWCVSGEEVRKVFESKEFARIKTIQQFSLVVYDDMDNPTDAVKKKKEELKNLVIRTKRFPAITCYTPSGKVFAQIENVPNSVDAEKLAKAVAKQAKRKDEAERLFAAAAKVKGKESADLYGQGFDILASMMGPFHFKELTSKGAHGWRNEWEELENLDAGDKYGWLAHFRMDEYETVRMVEKVTNMKSDTSQGSPESYVASVKAIPQDHFTANQKQAVKVMEYALHTNGSNGALSATDKALLKEAFDLGRDTFWGQFAMGRLIMDGEKIESKGLPRAKVVPRPTGSNTSSVPSISIEQVKSTIKTIRPPKQGEQLKEPEKLAIVRYAVLRLIGQKGWQKLVSRPGAAQFVKAFYNDREWMEDFAWSGTFPDSSQRGDYGVSTDPGSAENAILALESLVFQDKGRWCAFEGGKYENNEGRRFMTALAINYPDKDEEWLADVLDAYRNTALKGRLHKSAYSQPVWLWRYALQQGHYATGTDNMAAQQRHFDKFINVPLREYGSLFWMITYRMQNCFGDSVHGPWYYKPWSVAGEWPKRKYSQIVGGVCGELSKYSSTCSNSHGLPSCTVGQPGHCAFTRRLTDGRWVIDNDVTGHSQIQLRFWPYYEWQYVAALESTFNADREARLNSERMLTLAALAEEIGKDDKSIEKYYQHACAAQPGNFGAWSGYGAWLMRSQAPLDKIRVWVRGCARDMKAGRRQPLWNILTPYFERVAKENGKAALKEDIIDFAKYLKQPAEKLYEEADFKTVLEKWGALLEDDEQTRYDVLKAMLAAQFGTSDFFSSAMGWGSDYFSKSASGVAKFNQCLSEALEDAGSSDKNAKGKKKGKGGADAPKIDFAPLLLSASQNGNLGAFRQMVKMQQQMSPIVVQGQKYPASDFGGELLGAEGMLRTSTTSNFEHPERYPLCIDSSPCGEGAFHTAKETAPWAEVTLPGPTELTGIIVENRFGNGNSSRQVPLVVSVSEDGQSWQEVKTFDSAQDTYRIDLKGAGKRARYVKVGRKPGAKEDFFHLNKILVYGKKLW